MGLSFLRNFSPFYLVYFLLIVCVLSYVQLFATPWTVAHQAPLFMGFSRQEYWSRLPFPSPGDLPDPRREPASPMSPALAGGFFTTEPSGKPNLWHPIPLTGFLSWLSSVCLIPRSGRPPGGGQGNPLQFSPVLARRIPWTEKPGRLWSTGSQSVDTTETT